MVSSLFLKLTMFMALLMVMLDQIACTSYQDFLREVKEGEARERKRNIFWPEEALPFYKNCKGNLQTCSPCLSDAERECDALIKSNGLTDQDRALVGKNGGTCEACSRIAGGKCDSKILCGSKYDCGFKGDGYRCENIILE